MLDLVKIGKKILLCRCAMGMTQEMLAQRLYVSRQAVSSWEMGTRAPSLDSLVELSGLLQIGVEYSCAMKSHFREFGNQMSGSGNHLCNYASLLA